MSEKNVLDKLIAIQSSLPKKQEVLCSYILENYQEVGLMTVKELARKAGVGTTTVMRLNKALGYDNFFELKKDIHHIQIDRSDKWMNVQKSFDSNGNNSYDIISSVAEENMSLIEKSINAGLLENFEQAMNLIEDASKINLLGLRTYKGVALYMESLLIEFNANVQQLSHDSEAVIDRILQCDQSEVLILFSFSKYVQRTIDAAIIAKEKGIKIILITDELSCPISEYANVILRLDLNGDYFTVVPIINLIEAIVVDLGKRKSDSSVEKIQNLSRNLKERGVILE